MTMRQLLSGGKSGVCVFLFFSVFFAELVVGQENSDTTEVVRGDLGKKIDEELRQSQEGEKQFRGAVLVYADGEVKLAKGYGQASKKRKIKNTRKTLFDVASLTKQFTAAAALKLRMKEKLELSDSIGKFLEGVPEKKKSITIKHLLTHTSGLIGTIPDAKREGLDFREVDPLIKIAMEAPLQSEPGETFRYNNLAYVIVAGIIEKVSDTTFDRFLKREIFEPAGMEQTGFLGSDDLPKKKVATGYRNGKSYGPLTDRPYAWHSRGCTAVVSNVDDLLQWHLALMNDRVLSARARTDLFSPFRNDYALGWYVRKTSDGETYIEHSGTTRGFGSWYRYYRDRDALLVMLTNRNGDCRRYLSRVSNHISPLKGIVIVTSVREGTAAAKAGIQEGDEILSYGGQTIDSKHDLIKAKKEMSEKDTVTIRIKRNGETEEKSITTGRLGIRIRVE